MQRWGSLSHRPSHNDYTLSCICPIGIELAAVEGMLDDIHDSLPSSHEHHGYTLVRVVRRKVVLANMPAIGTDEAALVAMQLLEDFRSIWFGLLVRTGVEVPSEEEDHIATAHSNSS